MHVVAWSLLAAVLLYVLFVATLLALGRREDARAWGGLIPDCLILFRRLLGDPGIPRRSKWPIIVLLGYLALPFDLVPDFIPFAGQLDDVLLVALALRTTLRGTGPARISRHWPGPEKSLGMVLRLAGLEGGEAGGTVAP